MSDTAIEALKYSEIPNSSDTISRAKAIDAVCMEWCGVKHQDCKHPFDAEKDDYYWCDGCETALRTLPDLPSAEPEKVCIARINLSEEQVREAVEKAKSEIVQVLPSAEPRPRWIPCGERLPEEDVNVLVSYRYKEGEGDTSHSNIAITSYGQMYFGGNKVGIYHWRAPFKYFHNNYEVIAWMPLPEPYREEEKDG